MAKLEQKKRRGIQSVGIGMRVLSAVASMPGAASLSSIAQSANLSASQTHRYVSSLMAAGMVRQESGSGLYDLDAGAIRIGLAALSRTNAFANADRYMDELVRETHRTALITVRGDAGPTIIRWFPGSPPVMTALSIGSILPLLRSATGQIFFAFGDRGEIDRQVSLLEISDPASVPPDLDGLRNQLQARLFATLSGDLIPGLRAIAAPAFDLQGRLVLVATLIANAVFPKGGDAAAQRALLMSCKTLTESLGGRWPAGAMKPPAAGHKRRRRA
jgi:DNA-binding IclR family transcriptional regulator